MGFKTGQENVNARHKRELAEAQKALEYERTTRPMLELFADQLGNAMLVQLAHKPYKEWPQFAKDTFAYVATLAPTAAWAYKDGLPK